MATLLEHTVMPSGGDFTSLDACIDHLVAVHPNLVTADVYAEVKIDGTWSSADTSAVNIDGLTTDATHYLLVYTASAARHAGVWSASKHNLSITDASALFIRDDYVRIDGLQIGLVAPTSSGLMGIRILGIAATNNKINLSNLIIRGADSATYNAYGIYCEDADTIVDIWNCIIYGTHGAQYYGDCINLGVATANVYSCTLISGRHGLCQTAGTVIAKNCYAYGEYEAYGGTITKTTCASSDTTGSVGLQNIACGTDTFVNVTYATANYHLAADGLSPLQGVGTDTSGDAAPMNFTKDIDGDTRSGTWDIGADEYAAGGATYNESVTFSSGPSLTPSGIADLLGSVGLTSTPALSPAAIADFFDALTMLSSPAVSMACVLDMFPSLVLSSDPALAASAVVDFYNSLTLASTPAAVVAAVADLLADIALASNPAFAAGGGSDFYESLTFQSSPALSNAVFKEAFGELTLLSNPSLLMSNLADLLASLTLTSTPAMVAEFEGMITVVKRILGYVQDILRIKAVVQDIGRVKGEVVDLNRVKALLTDETIEELYDGGAFDAVPSGDIDCGAFEDEPDTIIDLGEW